MVCLGETIPIVVGGAQINMKMLSNRLQTIAAAWSSVNSDVITCKVKGKIWFSETREEE